MLIFPPLLYPIGLYIVCILGALIGKRNRSLIYPLCVFLSLGLALTVIFVHGKSLLQTTDGAATLPVVINAAAFLIVALGAVILFRLARNVLKYNFLLWSTMLILFLGLLVSANALINQEAYPMNFSPHSSRVS